MRKGDVSARVWGMSGQHHEFPASGLASVFQGHLARLSNLVLPPSEHVSPDIDTSIQPFDTRGKLAFFEQHFPVVMQLFRDVGIHPQDSAQIFDPYRNEISKESYINIGEHCIAVASAAACIAKQLGLDAEQVLLITERALVHDLNKPYEIMRKSAKRDGLVDEVYTASAYESVLPLLRSNGASEELVRYMANAGSEAGHNSLAGFIEVSPHGGIRLVRGRLQEKVVHLADDITYTNNPPAGVPVLSAFFSPWERMLIANAVEKYPFLWSEGLACDAHGTIVPVKNVKNPGEGLIPVGTYMDLQILVSNLIAAEFQSIIAPQSLETPEYFIKRIVRAGVNEY